jgi:preprotein translocase subunit SecA
MDYLREGIGLRAYSQKDPLVEYQREGYDLFNAMMEAIQEESVGFLFNLEVQVQSEDDVDEVPQISAKGLETEKQANLSYSSPSSDGSGDVEVSNGEETDADPDQVRQIKAKSKARQKSKAQRQSRKKNR